ncbi:MAG TPA: DinB family protein, partial [Candidatus Eisenbacteria bacterium]|nr:DinB family protein [Candidatus Eisenbacteria bacterium]
SPEKLMSDLRAAMGEVDRQLAGLSGEALLEVRTARNEKVTVLWCVYHIVEHFAMHTGQILSMTKALVGELRPAPELK